MDILEWRLGQGQFRWTWENIRRPININWNVPNHVAQGSLLYDRGHFTYRMHNVFFFLYLELATLRSDRLKKCARPDCPNPYFVAEHVRQTFCSDPCKAWAQKQWKLQWWREKGEIWRKERRQKKEASGGTGKAR